MIAYAVGQCYEEFKKDGLEGPMFDMSDIGQGLIMFYKRHPSDREVEEFNKLSEVELGLLYYHKIILLTFSSDHTEPFDMPYTPQLSHVVAQDELKNYPEPVGGLNILLLLIDSVTGEVKGIRGFGTDLRFHKEFAKDICDKMATMYSFEADQKAIMGLYSLYPTYNKLIKAADVIFRWKE